MDNLNDTAPILDETEPQIDVLSNHNPETTKTKTPEVNIMKNQTPGNNEKLDISAISEIEKNNETIQLHNVEDTLNISVSSLHLSDLGLDCSNELKILQSKMENLEQLFCESFNFR
eukprot:UN07488